MITRYFKGKSIAGIEMEKKVIRKSEDYGLQQDGLKQLAANRDDLASTDTPIIRGDLVMRAALNPNSKLHTKWDGPWVVLDETETDAYQLASANGHILHNLINIAQVRKLNADERKNWANDFWEASDCLKLYDTRAKEQREMRDLDVRLKEATVEHLEAQKRGEVVSLDKHAAITAERKSRIKGRRPIAAVETPVATTPEELGVGKRIRRLPFKLRDT
jgi:hypothetical protein